MNNNIRLFTGLSLPESVRSLLQPHISKWKSEFAFERWTHPDDWHITLHFLGNTNPSSLPGIRHAMEEAALETRQFPIGLDRLGVFGNPRRPSILFLGLGDPHPMLHSLHAALGSALSRSAGFQPETRPFHPHVTVARKYTGNSPITAVHNLPALNPGDPEFQWMAAEITLFQSHLGQHPMYEPIHKTSFTSERNDPDKIHM